MTIDAPSSNWKSLKKTLSNGPASPSKRQKLMTEKNANIKKRRRLLSFSQDEETINVTETENKSPPTSKCAAAVKLGTTSEDYQAGSIQEVDPNVTIGKYISIDCEFVGVGPGGTESALARVSIVNFHGEIILDSFVKTFERVSDYRTWVSGVRAKDLVDAPKFKTVQKRVSDILISDERILVGHAVQNDLKALLLSHPHSRIRDTSTFGPIRNLARTKFPSLRKLSELVLGASVQSGEHSSVEDARATMGIYRVYKQEWESTIAQKTKSKLKSLKKSKNKKQEASSNSGNIEITVSNTRVANLGEYSTQERPNTGTKATTKPASVTREIKNPPSSSQSRKRKRESRGNWWEE